MSLLPPTLLTRLLGHRFVYSRCLYTTRPRARPQPTPTLQPRIQRRTAFRARKAPLTLVRVFPYLPLSLAQPVPQTPAAISRLRTLSLGPEPRLIRIGVRNKGCAGMSYHLEYVESPAKFDEVVEQDGAKVLIDSKALFSIIGSEMDWTEDRIRFALPRLPLLPFTHTPLVPSSHSTIRM
jgi:iron-sulfur cluster assembly 1